MAESESKYRKITDQELVQAYLDCSNAATIAKRFGMALTTVKHRLSSVRKKGLLRWSANPKSPFYTPEPASKITQAITNYHARIEIGLESGIIIVGSDAHVWPGDNTTAQRGIVRFIRELKPSMVVMNGDIFDGSGVSRWPRIGWDKTPSVKEELDAVTEFLTKVEDASGNAVKVWPLGNHDARYETKLAATSPEYEGIKNFSLSHHYPLWTPCWSVMVNGNLLIKHRWKGGKYAAPNNALQSGVSMVTGHLHSLKWWPHTDETGTRFGVDGGCLAETFGQQFSGYTEDNPRDWRSGFVVLTIHKGKLLQPECARVIDEGAIDFRGTVVNV